MSLNTEKILGSKGAIRILNLLSKNGSSNISNISNITGLNYTASLRHLENLVKMGLIKEKRYGKIRMFEVRFNEVSFMFSLGEDVKIVINNKLEDKIIIGEPKDLEIVYDTIKVEYNYPREFSELLKTQIRDRDNYKCVLCNKTQREELLENNKSLTIHHLDENKENCDNTNLISVCEICHKKIHTDKTKPNMRIKAYSYLSKIYGDVK